MSFQYDQYLARHRANVKRGFDWLSENLPGLMTNTLTAGWNTEFAHDQSKNEPDEYEAYDAYFYGNNRSYEVVQRYQRAWLLHIHRNPHHWQHWVLIHDDMEDGELETVLEMPYDYIIEMICDWWSFSWQSGNLYEIFKWYEEHSKYIKLAQTTKITVEYILDKYYGVDTEYIGTIFTELRDKTISDNSSFYENSTIEETVDYLESDWELWLFWVIWIIVIGLCVFGFYYIDNEWIEN